MLYVRLLHLALGVARRSLLPRRWAGGWRGTCLRVGRRPPRGRGRCRSVLMAWRGLHASAEAQPLLLRSRGLNAICEREVQGRLLPDAVVGEGARVVEPPAGVHEALK